MWVVILYVCLTSQVCGFIDSPPVYKKADCEVMLEKSADALNADPTVSVFDGKCIHIKMNEASLDKARFNRKWLYTNPQTRSLTPSTRQSYFNPEPPKICNKPTFFDTLGLHSAVSIRTSHAI